MKKQIKPKPVNSDPNEWAVVKAPKTKGEAEDSMSDVDSEPGDRAPQSHPIMEVHEQYFGGLDKDKIDEISNESVNTIIQEMGQRIKTLAESVETMHQVFITSFEAVFTSIKERRGALSEMQTSQCISPEMKKLMAGEYLVLGRIEDSVNKAKRGIEGTAEALTKHVKTIGQPMKRRRTETAPEAAAAVPTAEDGVKASGRFTIDLGHKPGPEEGIPPGSWITARTLWEYMRDLHALMSPLSSKHHTPEVFNKGDPGYIPWMQGDNGSVHIDGGFSFRKFKLGEENVKAKRGNGKPYSLEVVHAMEKLQRQHRYKQVESLHRNNSCAKKATDTVQKITADMTSKVKSAK